MHNPLLEVPDPYQHQRAHQDKIRAEGHELQALCYDLFHVNPEGKKLYEILKNKYIIPAQYAPTHPHAANLALYWEGFKEAIRGLYDQGMVHIKRMNEG